MATLNINKLQRLNDTKITRIINGLDRNVAVNRGEDLDSSSLIEDILYNWANDVSVQVRQSAIEKGFNPAGNLAQMGVEPHVIDSAGVLKVLQLHAPDSWKWAEYGRGKSKRKGEVPLWKILEEWITYRGINVRDVTQWQRQSAKGKTVKPYKSLKTTLEMREVMARAFAQSIHKKGTIKRFGYHGSNYLSDVINQDSLNKLSKDLSEAVGYTIVVELINQL